MATRTGRNYRNCTEETHLPFKEKKKTKTCRATWEGRMTLAQLMGG